MKTAILVLGLMLLIAGSLHGQRTTPPFENSVLETQTSNSHTSLPKTPEEIDGAIAHLEKRLNEVRLKLAAPQTTESSAVIALSATADELTERELSLQQWIIALDQQARYLRRLKETRQSNEDHRAEQEAWRGFPQPPTLSVAEQLTDALSAQRLRLRTTQMLLPLLEAEIARYAARLNADRKQLRIASDHTEQGNLPNPRRQWWFLAIFSGGGERGATACPPRNTAWSPYRTCCGNLAPCASPR